MDMLEIGKVRIKNNLVLAPMAGVNYTSFRLLCKEAGAGLIYTQMYHADFICHKYNNQGKQAVFDFINIQEEERPVSIQLVGHNAENVLRAAKIIEEIADIIDINLGCCDTNIIKSGAGAFYAKNTDMITGLIRPLVKACKIPVTAKIRIGWDSQSINGVMVAQMLEKIGVSAVAVHGRVVTQKYGGKANLEVIKYIKQKLSIPVIGNGDVNNEMAAKNMLKKTGCDLVMIGRRAMGDPGFFTRCNNFLRGEEKEVISPIVLFEKFLDYYSIYDKDKSFSELRTHALWFSKRAGMGPKNRDMIMRAKDKKELEKAFGVTSTQK